MAAEFADSVPWYGVYDPRVGGAVVAVSQAPGTPVGSVFPLSGADVEGAASVWEFGAVEPGARLPGRPIVLAVVGDPNSGKSVFLHVLNSILRARGLVTLTQEADLVAPTSEWSLHAPDLRKELKKTLDAGERLRWVQRALEEAKRSGAVDVVLCDVGGGRPDIGVRITPENEAILKHATHVIVCSRPEGVRPWLEELKRKAPHAKVVAVLESAWPDPEGLRACVEVAEGVAKGVVSHLDRRAYVLGKIPEATKRVIRRVADLLVEA